MQEDDQIEWEDWEGRLFHVTSVINRESIDRHGLDWTRMGAAPAIDGMREPQAEGCFLGPEHHATFFVGFKSNPLVDVWLVTGIHWTQLVRNPEGFWYYPDRIQRSMLTLWCRDLETGKRGRDRLRR
jgi:hypothetical protein